MILRGLCCLTLLVACSARNPAFRANETSADADAITAPDATAAVDEAITAPDANAPDSALPTPADAAPLPPDTAPPAGLTGVYFGDNTLTTVKFQRIDPVVDFAWGNDPPDPTIPFAGFSVRWTGKLQTLYSESYTLSVHSGDGCRLWIDGTLWIDNWKNQAPTEVGKTAAITAGWHTIKLEYLHNTGWAVVRIFWESPSQKRGVVPSTYLLPK